MKRNEPLDPELASLFREEPLPEPPPLARARVLGRLETVIPAIGAGLVLPAHKAVGSALHASVVGTKVVALVATAFVVGGLAGGATVATVRPTPAPRVVYVDRPVSSAPAAPVAIAAPPSVATVDSAAPPSPPVDVRPVSSPAPSSSSDALSAERLLIDDARTKLASGDPTAALARLQEHAHRFPRGRLAEEREALAVQSLVQSGRFDAARTRAAQLHARWPESVFLPAVDTTIQSIP